MYKENSSGPRTLPCGTCFLVGRIRNESNQSHSHDLFGQPNIMAAAKPYLSKAVFRIDNVAVNIEATDIHQFVTCHKVAPRRPQWQRRHRITPMDCSTFRICISREDTDKLLKADEWPEHIPIFR